MNNRLAITAVLIIVAAASSLGTMQGTMAKKGTPFQAGYDHGCNDAKVMSSARYTINLVKVQAFIHKNL